MLTKNPERYKQFVNLLARITGDGHFKFAGEMVDKQYIFEKEGSLIPFNALSDGYRAFLCRVYISPFLQNQAFFC